MTTTIYRISLPLDNKCYVGRTTQDPDFVWTQHKSKLRKRKHPCKPLQEAVNEYGLGNTRFEILEVVPTDQGADAQECWMKQFDCYNHKVIKQPRKYRGGREVTWNDITYPSLRAAAKATGLSPMQLHERLEAGYERDSDYTPAPFKGESFPTMWDGTLYLSVKAASLAAGVSYAKMKRYRLLGLTTPSMVQQYEALAQQEQQKLDERRRLELLEEQFQAQQDKLARLKENIDKLRGSE